MSLMTEAKVKNGEIFLDKKKKLSGLKPNFDYFLGIKNIFKLKIKIKREMAKHG